MTTRRYTAEEMLADANAFRDSWIFPGNGIWNERMEAMLRQAARTEQDVQGLVEALEKCSETGPYAKRFATEALSKLRGGAE